MRTDPSIRDSATQDYAVWRRLAPLGLLLVGAGVCVTSDASARRGRGAETPTWVGEGTVGLIALNAGLSLFGEAVKRRALYDVGERRSRRKKGRGGR